MPSTELGVEIRSGLTTWQAYSLKLKPQTGRSLGPGEKNGIEQEIVLSGVPLGKGSSVQMRYKVAYQRDAQSQEEQGTVPSLGII